MGLVLGQPDVAIDRTAWAMRLRPLDPFMRGWQNSMAIGHFLASRYQEALSWAAKALQPDPDFTTPLRIAVASHALAGNLEQARATCERLRQLEPLLRVGNFRDLMGPLRPADFARWEEGLRMAGLPE
jgi:adenylate cyclase